MTRLLALFAALIAFTAVPAAAKTTRALIVGIDTYQYSTTTTRGAQFADLRGAVSDAVTFKNLLRTIYRIDLDRTVQGECPTTPHPLSTTLYNHCATRAAVLAALNDLVARSAAGDTLVFYFSGHGSLFVDRRFDQASGYNGTILPYDARRPEAEADGEIFDTELKAIKERAVARGIYWVTVFDSCNSGTATRDGALGQARSAPPVAARAAAPAAIAPASGPGGGYWVHLAAAQDGEQAMEVGGVGQRTAGVFTSALVETMTATPYASFADIIREVQAKVAARGRTAQNPMAEGELKAMLGRAPEGGVSFEVALEAGQPMLKAGRLSGVTSGSRFALFRRRDEAFAPGATPLLTAETGAVSDFSAELRLVEGALSAWPPLMVAVETQHAFGDAQVRVANRMAHPLERKAVEAALFKTGFVTVNGDPQVQIAPKARAPGEAVLLSSDGTEIGALGAVTDAGFAERVAGKLKKVLRAQQLLALRSDPTKAELSLCLDDSVYDPFAGACPLLERRNVRVVRKGERAFTTVINQAEAPRWLYVFGIDPSFGVALVYPKPGAADAALAPHKPQREIDDPVVLKTPGTYYFVTLATEAPIDAGALEQTGTRARAGTACDSVLEKLLCDAAEGKRDASAPKVGPWTARFDTVVVE